MKGSVLTKVIIAIVVIALIGGAVFLGIMYVNENNKKNSESILYLNNVEVPKATEVKEPKTFKGEDRPIAVMIDNHIDAMPQSGLNSAYMIYEFIVEGGQTRLMALFKGVDVEKIGPLRSSRHYYLDYALEHDAIYVHWGWSPQAETDISRLGINNINGGFESSEAFWRDPERTKKLDLEHTGVSSTSAILEIANQKGYEVTSKQKSVLNYVAEEIELDSDIEATTVTIPYSDYNTVSYEYDSTTKRYTRYSRDTKQTDWDTGETLTVKNIIIAKCKNWTISGDEKGRQDIDNIGVLEGYYITNGKAIPITAEKESRESQTVYKDLNGNEIQVNDGNTFVQVCPITSEIVIEPGTTQNTETTSSTVE